MVRIGLGMGRLGWVALLSVATVGQEAPEAIEQVVPAEWMPVKAFVVPEIALKKGSWKRNAGWSRRTLVVEHQAEGGVLEVRLFDGDGYSGSPLFMRFERVADGRVSATAAGREYSCVSRETFCDLHGEVRLQQRTAASTAPLLISFRIDGISDSHLNPLRSEGEVEVALAPGEWDVALEAPAYVEPKSSSPVLNEMRWRWPDGTVRAHGRVDALGRREGTWETWHADGSFQSVTEFLAGERHGSFRAALANGSLTREGRLEHGVEQGDWIETYQNELESESFRVPYRNGVSGRAQSLGRRSRSAAPDK